MAIMLPNGLVAGYADRHGGEGGSRRRARSTRPVRCGLSGLRGFINAGVSVVDVDNLPLWHGQSVQYVLPVESFPKFSKVCAFVEMCRQHLGSQARDPRRSEEQTQAPQALGPNAGPLDVVRIPACLGEFSEAEGYVEYDVEDGKFNVDEDHVGGCIGEVGEVCQAVTEQAQLDGHKYVVNGLACDVVNGDNCPRHANPAHVDGVLADGRVAPRHDLHKD
mmetsp:Transcript_2747/g.6824  ORF Transcript_2747/g.6824 Transcript_2747/m.6824 type:complete len:220 (+) Transcript_2747:801-1460(+)